MYWFHSRPDDRDVTRDEVHRSGDEKLEALFEKLEAR